MIIFLIDFIVNLKILSQETFRAWCSTGSLRMVSKMIDEGIGVNNSNIYGTYEVFN